MFDVLWVDLGNHYWCSLLLAGLRGSERVPCVVLWWSRQVCAPMGMAQPVSLSSYSRACCQNTFVRAKTARWGALQNMSVSFRPFCLCTLLDGWKPWMPASQPDSDTWYHQRFDKLSLVERSLLVGFRSNSLVRHKVPHGLWPSQLRILNHKNVPE